MSKVFMMADPHFGHINMAKKRGFETVEDHDQTIVDNWNSVVSKRDVVYMLGDITMEKKNYSILDKLNGKKKVVAGNHDLPQHSKELMKYVESISGMVKYKGCILTHCPIHETEIDRFRLNIHGHIHEYSIAHPRYVCVSMEHINYTPIEFTEIIKNKA